MYGLGGQFEQMRAFTESLSTRTLGTIANAALLDQHESRAKGFTWGIDASAISKYLSTKTLGPEFRGLDPSVLDRFTPAMESAERISSWTKGLQRVPSLFLRLEALERELAETDPACSRLSVLLDHVGVGRAIAVMEQMVERGTKPLVDLLEDALLDSSALEHFRHAVKSAALPDLVKGDLLHALDHLLEDSPNHALPPLFTGLEGAFRHALLARGDERKRSNARSIAAALGMKKDHELLIGTIYSQGNNGRHGADLDRREACVLALVGLVLWMDECQGEPAVEWLGQQLEHRLLAPAEGAA
jgi:hypothetical protein